jgi:hypothetical protein
MTKDWLILKLNAVASQIKDENELIGQRTTWLVMSQSFLFGALATLLTVVGNAKMAERAVSLLRILIPIVGLLLPSLVLLAVSTSIYAVWQLRREHDRLCDTLEADGFDWLRARPRWAVISGHLVPIAASVGFLVAWIAILVEIKSRQG